MITKLHHWLAFTVLLLFGTCSHAAITCNISSNGFSTAYFPANPATNITQTSFTVSCTRALPGDPTTVSYTVAAANNGLYANGINNRAFLSGSSYIKYDIYTDSACASQLKGNTTIPGSITFASTGTLSTTTNFWGCVPAAQTGLAAGTYTDAVTLAVTYGSPQATASVQMPVNIATPATCSMTTTPGTVAFGNYLAFGSALAASTGFGANCTNYLPYTLSVSPTTGTIAGVTYTLLLQDAATLANGTSLNVTGNGFTQTYSVNGSMAAGQSGVCSIGSCSGSVPHTLTLTY